MTVKYLIDLRWIRPEPMGGVETYAILGAKTFLNQNDALIIIPRKKQFEEIIESNNVIIDKHYKLYNILDYLKWTFVNYINHNNKIVITFNYYTPLLNSRSISTVMDLRLLNQGILRNFFFKINITPFGKKNMFYAISPGVQKDFKKIIKRSISYVATYIELKEEEISNKFNFKEEFALVISSDLPHKNLDLLFNIENQLPLNIIIIGPVYRTNKNYNTKKISHLGFVSKSEKQELIRKSKFLIFPTTFEGFGYPVVEAAQFNKKIICNNLKVFITLFKDYPIYTDCNDEISWVNQIQSVNKSLDSGSFSKSSKSNIDNRLKHYFDAKRFKKEILNLVK